MGIELKMPDVPKFSGEIIRNLPCELCPRKHTRLIGVEVECQGKTILVWEIHSPCIDKIARKAVGIVG